MLYTFGVNYLFSFGFIHGLELGLLRGNRKSTGVREKETPRGHCHLYVYEKTKASSAFR